MEGSSTSSTESAPAATYSSSLERSTTGMCAPGSPKKKSSSSLIARCGACDGDIVGSLNACKLEDGRRKLYGGTKIHRRCEGLRPWEPIYMPQQVLHPMDSVAVNPTFRDTTKVRSCNFFLTMSIYCKRYPCNNTNIPDLNHASI